MDDTWNNNDIWIGVKIKREKAADEATKPP